MATRYQADTPKEIAGSMNDTDMLAVIIALTASMTLVITTAIANAKLTRKVEYLRLQLRKHGQFDI
jgi:hypothetical protein